MQMDDDATQRLSASVEVLNARIARLAMALGIELNNRAEVDALMATRQIQPVAVERRLARADESAAKVTPERRTAHRREELRGLLVLRYHLEANSLNNNGLTVTRQALTQAADHLVRQGFKPGADGLGLDDLFNAV